MSAEVPESFSRYFSKLYDECKDTMLERQSGYGPTNIEALGPHGVFSRLASDKCARISNSMNGKVVNGKIELGEEWFNPGVRDALVDIANYALIMIAIGEKKWSVVSREEPSSY